MVLLCLFIPAACMLYIPPPMLLPVESLIFYLPSVSSRIYYFSGIVFCDCNVCNPCKLCCFFFFIWFNLLFCLICQIYICILKHNLILIFYFWTYLFFFRQWLIFFGYGWCTSLFITDDIIPAVICAGLYNFLTDIQPICRYNDRKSRKLFLNLFCNSDKCFTFTVLFYFFFSLWLIYSSEFWIASDAILHTRLFPR